MTSPDSIRQRRSVHGPAILSLIIIGAVIYGPFVGSTGFYWDDWPLIWIYLSQGARGLAQYFAGERPVSGWFYSHLFPLLGFHPVGWQVFSLAVRCLSSVTIYGAISLLLPAAKKIAWTAGAFLLLYPGFTQQAISLSYAPHQLSLLLFILSLTGSLLSIRVLRYSTIITIASVVAEMGGYLLTEYFTGLELIRPVCIWFALGRRYPHLRGMRARNALQKWSPYAGTWLLYVIFRVAVFSPTSYGPLRYKDVKLTVATIFSDPFKQLFGRIGAGVHNVMVSMVGGWCRPFLEDAIAPSTRAGILSWLPAVIVMGVSIYALRLMLVGDEVIAARDRDMEARTTWNVSVGLTVVGLLAAGLPFIVPGLRADFELQPSYKDRITLPFMLPASLFMIGLIMAVARSSRARLTLICGMLFICSAYQVQNEMFYRRDWLEQKSIFQQLAWRAPYLEPGTGLFVFGLPKSLYRNHSAGMLDLLYEGKAQNGGLSRFIFDMGQPPDEFPSLARLGFDAPGTISGEIRSFRFKGRTDESVVVSISRNGTVRVVTPENAMEVTECSSSCLAITRISHPEERIQNVLNRSDAPLLAIMGSGKEQSWLYFFQRAELERQLQHWAAVAALGDEASREGYTPADPSEWFPFVEGYAHVRRFDVAERMSERIVTESPSLCMAMSSLWKRMEQQGTSNAEGFHGALGICGRAAQKIAQE
jgi:hypothetical protein